MERKPASVRGNEFARRRGEMEGFTRAQQAQIKCRRRRDTTLMSDGVHEVTLLDNSTCPSNCTAESSGALSPCQLPLASRRRASP